MRVVRLILFIIFFSLVFLLIGCHISRPYVIIQTELGSIEVELYPEKAPVTCQNFLTYVDSNLFQGAVFYRIVRMDNQPDNPVKIAVIQGGLYEEDRMLQPIIHENTEITGIAHKNGVISMARNEPGSATSEFFICIGNQPELDFGGKRNPDGQGFSAFGVVKKGMEVVRRIHQSPAEEQWLNPKILIHQIIRR